MSGPPHLSVLGGGPAGLAVGWAARRRGLPVTLYEASDRLGGNCTTLRSGAFRYDSGAHRLHDRDPEITGEVRRLLGDDLRRVDVPSQIWDDGRLIRFPLSSAELLAHLGPLPFGRAALEVVRARLSAGAPPQDFEAFAVRRYGRLIAERFLLDYSAKLWGAPAAELSTGIAGQRLSGLDLRTFVSESVLGRSKAHVEGVFYYPRLGIGLQLYAAPASVETTLDNAMSHFLWAERRWDTPAHCFFVYRGVRTVKALAAAIGLDEALYTPAGLVFADGFESGTTGRWSLEVP